MPLAVEKNSRLMIAIGTRTAVVAAVREQGYRYARCYQCGRLATDIGGIIIDHDPAYIVEQAELIGWMFDGVKFTCRKCRKD